jgi:hypothetical protein
MLSAVCALPLCGWAAHHDALRFPMLSAPDALRLMLAPDAPHHKYLRRAQAYAAPDAHHERLRVSCRRCFCGDSCGAHCALHTKYASASPSVVAAALPALLHAAFLFSPLHSATLRSALSSGRGLAFGAEDLRVCT